MFRGKWTMIVVALKLFREKAHTHTHTHTHTGNDKSKQDRAGRVWPQEAEIRRIEASLGK
jgi:hypothetical protein